MNKEILNQKLIQACENDNLEEIERLVVSGADPNLQDTYGKSIFTDVFMNACNRVWDKLNIKEEYDKMYNLVKDTVNTLIRFGWDVRKYGLESMRSFVYMSNPKLAFDLTKFFLGFDLGDDKSEYESLLEAIGTEESYQRCCENDHDLENVFYSMYEMVDKKMEGLPYEGVELYYGAAGMKIDKILYLGKESIKFEKEGSTDFDEDICFVCGEKILVIRECVNVLFFNDIIKKENAEISDIFGDGVIGSTITDVSFEHKEIVDETGCYGQPVIILSMESGKKLKFTHNFGEHIDKVQASFVVE